MQRLLIMKKNINKVLFSTLLFLLLVQPLWSQVKEFEEVTIDSSERNNYGPNGKNFTGLHFGIGTFLNDNLSFSSIHFQFGSYYKRKISNVFSYGAEFGYGVRSIHFKNTYSTNFIDTFLSELPNSYKLNSRSFSFLQMNVAPFFRFNLDPKRKNHQGLYIDLGAYGLLNLSQNYNQVIKINDNTETRTHKGQKFVNVFNYEPFARIGYKKLAITAQYSLGNFWRAEYNNFPDLNPLLITISLR